MDNQNRRDFLKKSSLGGFGLVSSSMAMSAQSYRNILGSNDKLNVAICGLGRRLGAFFSPIASKQSNVRLIYLCDAMESQMLRASEKFVVMSDKRFAACAVSTIPDKSVNSACKFIFGSVNPSGTRPLNSDVNEFKFPKSDEAKDVAFVCKLERTVDSTSSNLERTLLNAAFVAVKLAVVMSIVNLQQTRLENPRPL